VSRSYRKPYAAITGNKSAHDDKKVAARGVRRRQNQWLRNLKDMDIALAPHRLECSFNNTYLWGRDGRQRLVHPGHPNSERYDFFYRYWVKLHRK
jgi:hypothetical protein